MASVPRDLRERLQAFSRVGERPAHREDLGECIVWLGGHTEKGYGFLMVGGKKLRAHRVAYELARGPVPGGLEIDHLCRVRNCINPAHLEPVTSVENKNRGLRSPLATHCPNGHEYSAGNLRNRPGKGRECAECHRASAHRRVA